MISRTVLLVLVFTLVFALPLMAQNARIQLIHNSADLDAGNMQINVDGDSLTSINFRNATPYQDIAGGAHDFEFIVQDPSGAGPVAVGPVSVNLTAGTSYVGIIDGISPLNLARGAYVVPDGRDIEMTIITVGDARETANSTTSVELFIHHGATDAEVVDIIANSTATLADDLDYGQSTGYQVLPPAIFQLDVTPGNDNTTILGTFEADLTGLTGGTAVVCASGFSDPASNEGGPEVALLVAYADGTTETLEDQTSGPIGEWVFAGAAPYVFDDFFGGDSLVSGGHGVQVDKNHRIWVGNFFDVLRVVDVNGVDAPFSPINDVTIGAQTIPMNDCRGLEIEADGNILFSQSTGPGGNVIRINAETGEGLSLYSQGTSQLKVGVDDDGFIYTGQVSGISPINVLEPTFFGVTQTITLDTPPSFGRGLAVSGDGLTLFTPDLAGSGAPLRIWSSSDGGLTYPMTDSVWTNTEGEQIINTNIQTFDWGPNGYLWVSIDHALATSPDNDKNMLLVLDLDQKRYWTLAMPSVGTDESGAEIGNGPRGVSFSATGDTLYTPTWAGGANTRMLRFVAGEPVSVKDRPQVTPESFGLIQNYPNPFNPTTTISFRVPQQGPVTLRIYNNLGQEVATLLDKKVVTAGLHEVAFDGANFASGVYYYKLTAGGNVSTKKMTLTK